MTRQPHLDLSRRERQIIDILYANGRATAAEVQALLPDPPSYSAVRAMLRILEDKGHVRHLQAGPRYLYVPTLAPDNAKKSAMRHMLQTFFDGALSQAISALVERRRWASARHLVWTLALVGALSVPVLSLALPRWTVPVVAIPAATTS